MYRGGMAKPKLLAEIQGLAAKKMYKAHIIANETGIALATVQRLLDRDESPYLSNVEAVLDFLRSAPSRKRGKKK